MSCNSSGRYFNSYYIRDDELYHHGVKGQRWGLRRFQNEDGSLTDAGRNRYGIGSGFGYKTISNVRSSRTFFTPKFYKNKRGGLSVKLNYHKNPMVNKNSVIKRQFAKGNNKFNKDYGMYEGRTKTRQQVQYNKLSSLSTGGMAGLKKGLLAGAVSGAAIVAGTHVASKILSNSSNQVVSTLARSIDGANRMNIGKRIAATALAGASVGAVGGMLKNYGKSKRAGFFTSNKKLQTKEAYGSKNADTSKKLRDAALKVAAVSAGAYGVKKASDILRDRNVSEFGADFIKNVKFNQMFGHNYNPKDVVDAVFSTSSQIPIAGLLEYKNR